MPNSCGADVWPGTSLKDMYMFLVPHNQESLFPITVVKHSENKARLPPAGEAAQIPDALAT